MKPALTHNPFSAARFAPGVVPWFGEAPDDLARMVERATRSGACHQLVGAHGTGKSTLLAHLDLEARRRGASVVRFRGSRGLPVARLAALARRPGARLVLCDELEELGTTIAFAALSLFARSVRAGLVVSAHRDLGVPTLARRRVDAATARWVIDHLTGSRFPERDASLEARLARHAGNLREVLFELYDEAEARPAAFSAHPLRGRLEGSRLSSPRPGRNG